MPPTRGLGARSEPVRVPAGPGCPGAGSSRPRPLICEMGAAALALPGLRAEGVRLVRVAPLGAGCGLAGLGRPLPAVGVWPSPRG